MSITRPWSLDPSVAGFLALPSYCCHLKHTVLLTWPNMTSPFAYRRTYFPSYDKEREAYATCLQHCSARVNIRIQLRSTVSDEGSLSHLSMFDGPLFGLKLCPRRYILRMEYCLRTRHVDNPHSGSRRRLPTQ